MHRSLRNTSTLNINCRIVLLKVWWNQNTWRRTMMKHRYYTSINSHKLTIEILVQFWCLDVDFCRKLDIHIKHFVDIRRRIPMVRSWSKRHLQKQLKICCHLHWAIIKYLQNKGMCSNDTYLNMKTTLRKSSPSHDIVKKRCSLWHSWYEDEHAGGLKTLSE